MAGACQGRGEIADSQLSRLNRLLEAILPDNPFWSARLASAGLGGGVPNLEVFIARCPPITKADLEADQQAHPPFGSNLTWPLTRYTRYHQTSGTTRRPLRWLDTAEDWDALVETWAGVFAAAGVGPGDRVLFAFAFGPFIGFWMAFAAAERLGCLCLPGGGLTSSARLRMLLETRATVLCCTPTYAARLAEVAREEGLDLASSAVRVILVAGEPGGSVPATRRRLEQLWSGARIFDHHGMTEVGPVTFECPAQPGTLHVIESAFLAEVLDPATGRPTPAGQVGELVLTPLRRIGSPLLRYRTGDLVRPRRAPGDLHGPPCACGRSELALEGGILGRLDDLLIVRGVNLYPSAVEEIVHSFAEVADFRAEVRQLHELPELSITVELVAGCSVPPEKLGRRIERAFQDAFALRVPVTVGAAGSLPRFEMKARRWVRGATTRPLLPGHDSQTPS